MINVREVIRWGPLGPGGDPAMSLQSWVPGVPVSGLGQANGNMVVPNGNGAGAAATFQTGLEATSQITLPAWQNMAWGAVGFGVGVAVGWFVGGR